MRGKMNQKSSIITFIISVFKVVVSQYGCNVNEILTLTINPCNTCEYRDWCPQDLGPGCDCFPGYLRNSLGICVPPESCDAYYQKEVPYDLPIYPEEPLPLPRPLPRPSPRPIPRPPPPEPRCRGRFEEYTECGSACPITCDNRSRFCPTVCVAGCFCRKGYLRNSQGICVRPDQCPRVPAPAPKQCGPNEEYRPCGSACPSTCDNLGGGQPCTLQCVPGCFCIGRLVRKDGKCVFPSECRGVQSRQYRYPPPPPPLYNPPVRPPPYVPALNPPPPPLSPKLPPRLPPSLPLPPPKAAYPPPALPLPPVAPPKAAAYPPPAPPLPPVAPPPVPPPSSECSGCPNRSKCNRCCKSSGSAVGFCVGDNFLQCSCLG